MIRCSVRVTCSSKSSYRFRIFFCRFQHLITARRRGCSIPKHCLQRTSSLVPAKTSSFQHLSCLLPTMLVATCGVTDRISLLCHGMMVVMLWSSGVRVRGRVGLVRSRSCGRDGRLASVGLGKGRYHGGASQRRREGDTSWS